MTNIVIVGGGICGITVAYLLSFRYKNIILIDKFHSLGGAHRALYIRGYLSEHSPRVYSTSYTNTIKLLGSMGLNFYDFFIPYKYNFTNIGILDNLTIREIMILAKAFFSKSSDYAKTTTVKQFITYNGFSVKAADFLNRLCLMLDGGGIDTFTLYELLNIVSDTIFHTLYQPKYPNSYLFGIIKDILIKRGVKIVNSTVKSLLSAGNKITHVIGAKGEIWRTSMCILAIPPIELCKILNNSDHYIKNSFGPYKNLLKWANNTNYIPHYSATLHWKEHLTLPNIHGFPFGKYKITFIVLTDYMKLKGVGTVISATSIYKLSKDQFYNEFKMLFGKLPNPEAIVLNTANDTAFFRTIDNMFLYPKSNIPNLYSVGTHNGNSNVSFTCMESAVTNAIYFVRLVR